MCIPACVTFGRHAPCALVLTMLDILHIQIGSLFMVAAWLIALLQSRPRLYVTCMLVRVAFGSQQSCNVAWFDNAESGHYLYSTCFMAATVQLLLLFVIFPLTLSQKQKQKSKSRCCHDALWHESTSHHLRHETGVWVLLPWIAHCVNLVHIILSRQSVSSFICTQWPCNPALGGLFMLAL